MKVFKKKLYKIKECKFKHFILIPQNFFTNKAEFDVNYLVLIMDEYHDVKALASMNE